MAATMTNFYSMKFLDNKSGVWAVSNEKSVFLALYEDVENCKELKQMAVDGKIDGILINPAMIIHPFQVLMAARKATHNMSVNKMTTKKFQTEVLYSLSANKNITDSLIKFGITDQQRSILLAVMSSPDTVAEDGEKLGQVIQGRKTDLSSIGKYTDEKLIKKVYKVKDPELEVGLLLDAVIGRIASKDFVSF
ncbi:EKC/KEOPS complex subunit Tprkb-like [Lineus longissimus]|uniref:EKC/KEOPS complex subunit Tprkb-like n=1 Tax=Lineus longissimus TaxID=88925 RepID=UPI002B4CB035